VKEETMKYLQIVSRDGVPTVDIAEDKDYNPFLGDNQVLVKMEAAVINGSDQMFIAGRYAVKATMSAKASGTVSSLPQSPQQA
jgi:NADPH:quinone reductase-like Zn-dependent oxidoreductase